VRYAIISDIHGNLVAMEAVLKRIKEEQCDRIICLGDIVGYGPFPNECIDVIQQNCYQTVIGNHDHAAIGLTSTDCFNIYAKMAIEWTSAELTTSSKQFLKNLEFQYSENDILFVHATPLDPEDWNYILSISDAGHNFKAFEEKVSFIGHSHVPMIFEYESNNQAKWKKAIQFKLNNNFRYIVNVGSVGQPRDGNNMSSFGIFDSDSKEYQMVRQEYDFTKTQKAMMEKDLPYFLVERLSRGQ
jgi:predicted phosphodiesterase